LERDQGRIAELEGLFAGVDSGDEDEEPEESEDGVLPKGVVKSLKDERKDLAGELKAELKLVKLMRQDLQRMEQAGFAAAERKGKRSEITELEGRIVGLEGRIEQIDERLARHSGLEAELKALRGNVREVEKRRDELVEQARERITPEEAQPLIMGRFERLVMAQFEGYLRQDVRAFVATGERLWEKYAVTLKEILAERDAEAEKLNRFLVELGYE
jgi:type I restriction enzyme M protein